MPRMYLSDELRPFFGRDVFTALWKQPGKTYRKYDQRRTFRFIGPRGVAYFAKLHDGAGWRHILKNAVILKPFVLGARNEFVACRHLATRGVHVPRVAGFGERGANPARRQSFVICEALDGYSSLKDLAAGLRASTTTMALRRKLMRRVAIVTRAMHASGVNHRDYYTWHLMVENRKLAAGEVELAIIDLHRAQVRRRVPDRWRERDLAALLYSCGSIGWALNRGDLFRFVRDYTGERPAVAIRRRRRFWDSVIQRSTRLAVRRAARKARSRSQ